MRKNLKKNFFLVFFFSPNHVVYLQFRLVSSILELQSKSWILELKLELSALWELSQSCSSNSAFRKGLDRMPQSNFNCIYISCNHDCYPEITMRNRQMIFSNCPQKILQAFLLLLNWCWLCLYWLSKCFPYFCRSISFLSIKSKSQASRGWCDVMTKVGCRNQVLSAIDCCNGTLQFANCE